MKSKSSNSLLHVILDHIIDHQKPIDRHWNDVVYLIHVFSSQEHLTYLSLQQGNDNTFSTAVSLNVQNGCTANKKHIYTAGPQRFSS